MICPMQRRSFLLTPALAASAANTPTWINTRPRLYYDSAAAARIERGPARNSVIERAKGLLDAQLMTEDVAERGGGQHTPITGLPAAR